MTKTQVNPIESIEKTSTASITGVLLASRRWFLHLRTAMGWTPMIQFQAPPFPGTKE